MEKIKKKLKNNNIFLSPIRNEYLEDIRKEISDLIGGKDYFEFTESSRNKLEKTISYISKVFNTPGNIKYRGIIHRGGRNNKCEIEAPYPDTPVRLLLSFDFNDVFLLYKIDRTGGKSLRVVNIKPTNEKKIIIPKNSMYCFIPLMNDYQRIVVSSNPKVTYPTMYELYEIDRTSSMTPPPDPYGLAGRTIPRPSNYNRLIFVIDMIIEGEEAEKLLERLKNIDMEKMVNKAFGKKTKINLTENNKEVADFISSLDRESSNNSNSNTV